MSDDGKGLGLSIWDSAMVAAELGAGLLGPSGLPAQAPLLDDTSCAAVVQPVEVPDWVESLAELRQDQLLDAGNEAVPVATPEMADHAPPVEPMGLF